MSGRMQWLEGRRALVLGQGAAVDAVAHALAEHGATVAIRDAAAGEQEVAAQIDEAASSLGGAPDLLVHAGVDTGRHAAVEMGVDDWRRTVSADLDSRFLATTEFARRRIAAGQAGAVLLLMPPPGRVHATEGASVGALDNLVKSLAVEWARDGLRVNAIASRHVATDAQAGEALDSLGHLAAYVLSDYGAYITGATLGVDD